MLVEPDSGKLLESGVRECNGVCIPILLIDRHGGRVVQAFRQEGLACDQEHMIVGYRLKAD